MEVLHQDTVLGFYLREQVQDCARDSFCVLLVMEGHALTTVPHHSRWLNNNLKYLKVNFKNIFKKNIMSTRLLIFFFYKYN